MRHTLDLCQDWLFTGLDGQTTPVTIPHTWNNIDGQDGGNDYKRGACTYMRTFPAPAFDAENEEVWLEFDGVNSSARVDVNGKTVATHDGGYSTFRANITGLIAEENTLTVAADNTPNDKVYPQKADFTFYGGIYRGVRLVILNKAHFALDYLGSTGIRVTPTPEGKGAKVRVQSRVTMGEVVVTLRDHKDRVVGTASGTDVTIDMEKAHRWHGVEDPYLYTCHAEVVVDGVVTDAIDIPFGVRDFRVDPKKGFILNGKEYPLRGVSRHQDRKGLGNAISRAAHDEDMALIAEMGCNTVRLAHYQHDQYFYDLCDKYGMVVWAEIPYISEHMPNGRENTISQMKELIVQNYNHPSICFWGISNEITISTKDNADMMDNHRVLNDLIHEMDPSRPTTLACYSVCGPFNPVAHKVSDIVSWNLYLGWYVPGMFLNDLWVDFFHKVYPNRCLGYSEYGCECMPNLHTSKPKRGDQSEEYQCLYNEYMLKFFEKRPFMWATHLWNMFDFAADARNQGGEPGMNHKGLVTFDRKTRKDSFYVYKAYWSKDPFVYICGRRYVDRPEHQTTVKVYSNQPKVTLYANGKKVAEQTGDKIFTFELPLDGEVKLEAVAGSCRDNCAIRYVSEPNPTYKLGKDAGDGGDWAAK